MVYVCGVDGCKAGWFRAMQNMGTKELYFDIFNTFNCLVEEAPLAEVVTVDIPIGLPDKGQRRCDKEARQVLRKRHSTVFSAPIRPAIYAKSREEAAAITQTRDGRKVGSQAWSLYPKIREVDDVLQKQMDFRRTIIREVHPEVCFWNWADGRPMSFNKKTLEGKRERLKCISPWFGENVIDRARGNRTKKALADDDILDAIAALRSAIRIYHRNNKTLPEYPDIDATGRPMEMAY